MCAKIFSLIKISISFLFSFRILTLLGIAVKHLQSTYPPISHLNDTESCFMMGNVSTCFTHTLRSSPVPVDIHLSSSPVQALNLHVEMIFNWIFLRFFLLSSEVKSLRIIGRSFDGSFYDFLMQCECEFNLDFLADRWIEKSPTSRECQSIIKKRGISISFEYIF